MTRIELYRGYRQLLDRLYDYGNYRARAMALIQTKGSKQSQRLLAGSHDLGIFLRVLWHCVFRASPRRAWLTVSMLLETLWRRPRQFRLAVSLALMHKHFYEYVRDLCVHLDDVIADLEIADPKLVTVTGDR